MNKFKEKPNEEKPRERLLLYGKEKLSNEELLMIILKTGTKELTVQEVSNNLLVSLKDIRNLKNITYNKLISILPSFG